MPRLTIKSITEKYNEAVRAYHAEQLALSKLTREHAETLRDLERSRGEVAALTKIAVSARVERWKVLDDLHALALTYYGPGRRRGLAGLVARLAAAL